MRPDLSFRLAALEEAARAAHERRLRRRCLLCGTLRFLAWAAIGVARGDTAGLVGALCSAAVLALHAARVAPR